MLTITALSKSNHRPTLLSNESLLATFGAWPYPGAPDRSAVRCYWSLVFAGARRTLVLVITESLLAACFTRRRCVRSPFAGRLVVLTVLVVFSAMLLLPLRKSFLPPRAQPSPGRSGPGRKSEKSSFSPCSRWQSFLAMRCFVFILQQELPGRILHPGSFLLRHLGEGCR